MRVREPNSLRLVREFPKATLRLASEKDSGLFILGQSIERGRNLLFTDYCNQRVKMLDLQTGDLQVAFEEREPGWGVSNARLFDTQLADALVVTETKAFEKGKKKENRVVIAKKNTDGIYLTDHVVELDEATEVCLCRLPFE